MQLGTPYKAPTREGLLMKMAVNKLAPSAAMLEKFLNTRMKKVDGKEQRVDEFGNPYEFSKEFTDHLYPIYWGTIKDLAKDGYDATDALLTFYAFFGGGVQQYDANKGKNK